MLGILRALMQVLHIWWTKDRIRVARSEGKLFRVCAGDRLLIDDRLFHVVARHDSESTEMARVRYELAEELGESSESWSLDFTMQNDIARLCHSGRILEIDSERIVVLGRLEA